MTRTTIKMLWKHKMRDPKYNPHIRTTSGDYAYPELHEAALQPKPHPHDVTKLPIPTFGIPGLGLAGAIHAGNKITDLITGSGSGQTPSKSPNNPITTDKGHPNPSAMDDKRHISASSNDPRPVVKPKAFNPRANERLSKYQLHALLSEAAYLPIRPSQIGQYTIDEELSGKKHLVYVRKSSRGNRVVIAYRGTADAADLYSDSHIVAGTLGLTARAKEARAVYNRALKKYRGRIPRARDRIEITGHSLGGALAYEVAKEGSRGSSFNMGAYPNIKTLTDAAKCQIAPKFAQPSVCNRFTQFRMAKDGLSLASTGLANHGKTFGGSKLGLESHKISNFTNDPSVWKGLAY